MENSTVPVYCLTNFVLWRDTLLCCYIQRWETNNYFTSAAGGISAPMNTSRPCHQSSRSFSLSDLKYSTKTRWDLGGQITLIRDIFNVSIGLTPCKAAAKQQDWRLCPPIAPDPPHQYRRRWGVYLSIIAARQVGAGTIMHSALGQFRTPGQFLSAAAMRPGMFLAHRFLTSRL